jgi:hypothetical protein
LDVWTYIMLQDIPVVPLYFAKERPVVSRNGTWIMVDDDRMPLEVGEKPQSRLVRFRTLGCYPLTGAIDSSAATLEEIVAEMQAARVSERQGRLIDTDECKIADNSDPLRGDFRIQFRPLLTCCVSVLPFGPAGPGRALGNDWRGEDRRDSTRLF